MESCIKWWQNNTVRQSSEIMVGRRVQDGSVIAAVEGTPKAEFLQEFPLAARARIDFTEIRRFPVGPWSKVLSSAQVTEI